MRRVVGRFDRSVQVRLLDSSLALTASAELLKYPQRSRNARFGRYPERTADPFGGVRAVAQAVNRYKADLREIQFLLFEQFKLEELLGQGAVRGVGRGRGRAGARPRCYRFACEVPGPLNASATQRAASSRTARSCTPTGFKEAWKKLYEAGWKSLAVEPEHGGAGRAAHAAGAGRGDALRLEHRVQHVPGLTLRRGRGDRQRSARRAAASCTASKHVQRHVGRHDVPHRAAGRQRRRRGKHRGQQERRRQLRHQRHQDLHLRRRSRPRREHHPPGARARRRRAGGHQGPLAVHRAEGPRRRRRQRSASRTTCRRRRSSTRWASTARRPACSTSARTAPASAACAARSSNQGMAQMFQMMNGARIAVGIQGLAVGLERVPQRARLREGAQAGRVDPQLEGRRPRRACRSSSTPTCGACCST